jgi:hypothetical protein
MIISFLVAIVLELIVPRVWPGLGLAAHVKLVIGVALTTVAWVAVTFLTPPSSEETLRRFCRLARPGGPGWRQVADAAAAAGEPLPRAAEWTVPRGILAMVAGSLAVYAALFGTGYWIYGLYTRAGILTAIALAGALSLVKIWDSVAGRGSNGDGLRSVRS